MPTIPPPSPFARHFPLDPTIVFLNHGSFGSTPLAVLEAQNRHRALMESEPIRFFVELLSPMLDSVRTKLAAFLSCDAASIAPVPNATIGVATVFQNLKLQPGDEILINDHEYPACCNNARALAARTGAQVITAQLPFPVASADDLYNAIMAKVTPRTKIALISHVTSPSALILPIERLVRDLSARNIETMVDGAHAPGFVHDLNLARMKPTYYTANCHKWICSPKGSAFLYVDPAKRESFRPAILSNNAESPREGRAQFLTEFDFVGTSDPSAFLSVSDAIDTMGQMLPGGWPAVIDHNQKLVRQGRTILCEKLGVTPPCPEDLLGCTATIILPGPQPGSDRHTKLLSRKSVYHDALQDRLLSNWRIQVPIWNVAARCRTIRLSAQLYNSLDQYEYLAKALTTELAAE